MRKRRLLSLFLALCLVLGMNDMTVWASVSMGDAMSTEVAVEPAEETVSDGNVAEIPVESTKVFTDDTGMEVILDTQASQEYIYQIEDGVLVSVTDSEGNPLTGNVELAEDKGITAIDGAAFSGNTDITYVKLPAGVTTLQENSFMGMTALRGVYLPAGVAAIGDSAFEGCSNMTQIALPKSVTVIGNRAFYQNTKLFMVFMKDVENSVLTSIGAEAFYGCTALSQFCSDTEFILPAGLTAIGERAFMGAASIRNVDMHDSVVTLGAEAFRNCKSIQSVVLSNKTEIISDYAFAGCNNLLGVTFKKGNTEIGANAFEGCFMLGSVELPYSVGTIGAAAFEGCSNLVCAKIPNGNILIAETAFPNLETLTLYGLKDANVETYVEGKKIKFVAIDADEEKGYFKYSLLPLGDGLGDILVRDKNGVDPNTVNDGIGVAENTELYVYITPNTGSRLVEGSVKCNGVPMAVKPKGDEREGVYFFKMPVGGALITAEFENTGANNKTEGTKDQISVALSNGAVYDANNQVYGAELKAGQYTRMFLIDSNDDNKTVPSSKITFKSQKPTVATITDEGIIYAVKAGTTKITASATGADNVKFTKEIIVNVSDVKVQDIRITAKGYSTDKMEVVTEENGLVTIFVEKYKLAEANISFKLSAKAYDVDADDTTVALKWSSSDTNIAKLQLASTQATAPENTVTIPAGMDGEATITVTATNADGSVAKQKVIISIKDYTPRLASNSLKINANRTDGAVLEVIAAYGNTIRTDAVKLMNEDGENENKDFSIAFEEADGTGSVYRFRVQPRKNIENGSYKVNLNLEGDVYVMPLYITVYEEVPNPKVTIPTKQEKINLFYGNDGTVIQPQITGLNGTVVAKYTLEPLSNSQDDLLFVENFEVNSVTGVITQKSENMLYTSKKKPAVTGYLVLSFEGYEESVVKKYRITIPTTTKAPAFCLDKTSGTFNSTCSNQEIVLQLLDTRNKKQPVFLDPAVYHVTVLAEGATTDSIKSWEITEEGKIKLVTKQNPKPGRVYLQITNDEWTDGKAFKYAYSIKTANKDPRISLVKSSVTVNALYPEQSAGFAFKSDQNDTIIADTQTFVGKSNKNNAAEYAKLSVTYEGGVGKVQILDSSIKNGTYTFECAQVMRINMQGAEVPTGKVTLRVSVNKPLPTVSLSGKLNFNMTVMNTLGEYVEVGELIFNVKKLPEAYSIDVDKTLASITCTTRNCENYEDYFQWDIAGNKLLVSLKSELPQKTYSFSITPTFVNGDNTVETKTLRFNVKTYKSVASVNLTAKGKINLLDREPQEYTLKNSMVFTPSFKNIKDTVVEAKVYDAGASLPTYGSPESAYFEAYVVDGKIYVTPKPGAELDNNKNYSVKIWIRLENYAFSDEDGYGTFAPNVFKIRTAQVLPKVESNREEVNLYLANKNYVAAFVVSKTDSKSVGLLEDIVFAENDIKAKETFDISCQTMSNGDLKVLIKLKNTVSYGCNTTNKITLYTTYQGQGANTSGLPVRLDVKINK